MVFELVFDWLNAMKLSPKLSRARIKEIRGYQSFLAIEFVVPGARHFIFRKSSIPSQVSSMLIIRVFVFA